jgi:hypothetical protein
LPSMPRSPKPPARGSRPSTARACRACSMSVGLDVMDVHARARLEPACAAPRAATCTNRGSARTCRPSRCRPGRPDSPSLDDLAPLGRVRRRRIRAELVDDDVVEPCSCSSIGIL